MVNIIYSRRIFAAHCRTIRNKHIRVPSVARNKSAQSGLLAQLTEIGIVGRSDGGSAIPADHHRDLLPASGDLGLWVTHCRYGSNLPPLLSPRPVDHPQARL